ncbi:MULTISPECIES: ABC transporter permease [Micrococcaceae]|uniref:ABC transporter permease n=1 Tax=Micrococcaceae TaxID=1268 RepID=UPI0010357973|nr:MULTISPECIES: ABC transporter permease [Micrococcaceae]TAP28404.1 ABC transporter permease [Arthrobacter sp. S41]UXN32807.1 ABC transporter permease [Glutamicibacter sp. M10]
MTRIYKHRLFWPLVALAALLLACSIKRPDILGITVLDGHLFGAPIDILRNSAPLLLVALGMTLVIATRGIDLSVGATVAIAGAVALTFIASSDQPGSLGTALGAIFVAVGLCFLLGCFNGLLVAKFGIQPIIATLILMTAGRGMAMLITNGQITTVTSAPFSSLASGFLMGLPVAAIIAYGVYLVVSILVRRTALGMLLESVGINPEASRLAGVKSKTLVFTVYALCGLLAGLAGLIFASNTMAADANNAGLFIELDAILAVVIGGTSLAGGKFNLSGTLIGVLIITTLSLTVTVLGVSPLVTSLFKAIVVIAVTLMMSTRLRTMLAGLRERRRFQEVSA